MRRAAMMIVLAALTLGVTGCQKKAEEAKEPAAKQEGEAAKKSPEAVPDASPKDLVAAPEPGPEADVRSAPEKEPETAADVRTARPREEVKPAEPEVPPMKHLPIEEVKQRQKRFVPVRIEWDQNLLDDGEKELVRTLVRAARVIDHIFWMQTSPDALEWRKKLAQLRDPESRALFHYLMVNYGPYDRLNGDEPFLGETPKPAGANYYPVDMPKEELEEWLAAHPEDEEAFKSNFTVIRREGDKLVAVPYSKAYGRELQAANRLLLQAAEQAQNESLKKVLKSRGEAFLSDDYFQSDMDWVDLDSKIEVTIGPYEVYEDHLFGYKAAFEAFVTVKDPAATAKLDAFKEWLDKLEKNLPIPDEHKNFKRGASSPLPVVDVVFTAGDTRAGVQTIAFNLPNDERVREQKGSKKVMLRNVGMAKFHKILKPIARRVLVESKVALLHQDAYFNHTLLHEIAHGLGPGTITVDGKETTVNLALKELYSHLEEAKADILGLYNALYLIDQDVVVMPRLGEDGKPLEGEPLDKLAAKEAVVATFVAGIFRSTRFGVEEAHGKANLMLFNYLHEKGGILVNSEGRMDYDFPKLVEAVTACAHDLLMIQAAGDYEAGKAFIEKYGEVHEPMEQAWAHLAEVPVDIEPIYEVP
jgi:hypothetical protein